MFVSNGASNYEVGKQVAETDSYRVYICKDVAADRQCLLQIAAETTHNGGLDRTAYILKQLAAGAEAIDAALAKQTGDPDKRLGYGLLFPELLDSFMSAEQGKRRINILAFRGVDQVSKMVPLSNLVSRDRLRVDLRTSAWIEGRLLKLLGFVHREGIAVRVLGGNNILLEPGPHYVVTFDWSSSRIHPGEIPTEERAHDISQASRAVIAALGGNPTTGHFPGADESTRQYTDYLLYLANHRENNASRAHHKFYEIVDGLWERKYYPFTTAPLN